MTPGVHTVDMPMRNDARGERENGWRPPAGASLLERLRVTGRSRPAADPDVAAHLRALLGAGLAEDVGTTDGDGRIVVTKERLTRDKRNSMLGMDTMRVAHRLRVTRESWLRWASRVFC